MNIVKRMLIWSLVMVITISTMLMAYPSGSQMKVQAAGKLKLSLCRTMAVANSDEYDSLVTKRMLQEVTYNKTVKSANLKVQSKRQFRWSPLLSFHFPEPLNYEDQYNLVYKPAQAQSQIQVYDHKIKDRVYEEEANVTNDYIDAYILQEKIEYNNKRLAEYQDTLAKNRLRLSKGLATQSDIDKIQKKIDKINTTLASNQRDYEAKKKAIGTAIGMDIMTGYTFENPNIQADIPRSKLEELIQLTISMDQERFEKKIEEETARIALSTSAQLLSSKYGSDYNMVRSYIDGALRGEKINKSQFKAAFDAFLDKIDSYWRGSKRIIFFKFPKVWFKGEMDGVRYIEDEPYSAFENAMDYQSACKELTSTENQIRKNVTANYENYVSVKNSLAELQKQVAQQKKDVDKGLLLNKSGRMTYDEYSDLLSDYEDAQLELLDLQSQYSQLLVNFNRLTCGNLQPYIQSMGTSLAEASGGESYIVADEGNGIYYYITQLVENNIFELGLAKVGDVDVEASHFELWVDGVKIGSRTEFGKPLRHLTLDLSETKKVFIRLYNGDKHVDDCEIDPTQYSGKLNITKGYDIKNDDVKVLGEYEVESLDTGLMEMTITPEADNTATHYLMQTKDGKNLLDDSKISVKDSFKYLSLTAESVDSLRIIFYDANGKQLSKGRFVAASMQILEDTTSQ